VTVSPSSLPCAGWTCSMQAGIRARMPCVRKCPCKVMTSQRARTMQSVADVNHLLLSTQTSSAVKSSSRENFRQHRSIEVSSDLRRPRSSEADLVRSMKVWCLSRSCSSSARIPRTTSLVGTSSPGSSNGWFQAGASRSAHRVPGTANDVQTPRVRAFWQRAARRRCPCPLKNTRKIPSRKEPDTSGLCFTPCAHFCALAPAMPPAAPERPALPERRPVSSRFA
jgi:hypothetical protein